MRLESIAIGLPCAACDAKPGEACKTVTGRRAVMPHVARMEPVAEAYAIGYTDAERCTA